MKKINRSRGVSLLEVLLSIALIAILSALSIPVYERFQVKNDLSVASSALAQSFRRAQVLSRGVEGDSEWGVKIAGGNIIIFKGSNYAGRDADYDEEFSIPENINIFGISEIAFRKLTGIPQSTGTAILTDVQNESVNLTVNSMGMVEY